MATIDHVNFTIRNIPIALWRQLRHLAVERDMSLQALLIEMLQDKATAKGKA